MVQPRVCVLRAPGTNCDVETAFAFEHCGARADRVHLFRILEEPRRLLDYQMLCIPGGFSYGDDIGAGVIFGSQLRGHLAEVIGEFLSGETLTLGICNGFQVLLKVGLLPGGADAWPPEPNRPPEATLTWNDNGKYTAIWVQLETAGSNSVFLRGIERIELPVAHAEGKITLRDESVLARWRSNGQIALCYADTENSESLQQTTVQAVPVTPASASATAGTVGAEERGILPYPANPNGSVANIAGLCDPTGRILGLMPHPERFLDATQHPRWTRLGLSGEGAGMKLFRNAVEYFR